MFYAVRATVARGTSPRRWWRGERFVTSTVTMRLSRRQPNKRSPAAKCRGASCWCSALDRIRTCGLRLRRATLYPAELRAQMFREANKPSSVPGEPGEDHFSGTGVAAGLVQPTRDCEEPGSFAGRAAPRHCLALLRVGLAVPRLSPAARCALTVTVSPLPVLPRREPSAVCFLLRFPSPRNARTLSGTLPCGARTFLDAEAPRSSLASQIPNCQKPRCPGEDSNLHAG